MAFRKKKHYITTLRILFVTFGRYALLTHGQREEKKNKMQRFLIIQLLHKWWRNKCNDAKGILFVSLNSQTEKF